MSKKVLFARLAVMSGALALASTGHAAAIDVEDVVTDIGLQIASITAIGAAVLIVHAAVKAFKWVRAAMS